jgi:hypothetical protein
MITPCAQYELQSSGSCLAHKMVTAMEVRHLAAAIATVCEMTTMDIA